MKADLLNIFRWLTVAAVALVGAFLISYTPNQTVDGNLLISLSFVSEDEPIAVSVSFLNHNGNPQVGTIASSTYGHQTLVFEFSPSKSVESLGFQFGGGHEVILTGISIVQGGFQRTFSGQELQEGLTESSAFKVDDRNLLVLSSSSAERSCQLNDRFFLNEKPATVFRSVFPSWSHTVDSKFFAYSLLILLTLLVVVGRRTEPLHHLLGFSLAFVTAALVWLVMDALKREVTNANVSVSYESTHQKPEFELYYSPDGLFKNNKIVNGEVSGSTTEFQLPDGLHRQLRLDIPKNDTLVISEFKINYWPFNPSLSGYDLAMASSLKNDMQFELTDEGELRVYSGAQDPYLVVTDEDLLAHFLFYQTKRRQYPIWLSVIIFMLIIAPMSLIQPRSDVVLSAGFICVLCIPSTTFMLKENVLTLETEKRLAFPKPSFDGNLLNFALYTSGYLEDQFGGRAGMITAWNFLKVMLYGQTANSAAVVFGRDGWMFYRAEGVQEVYENKQPFSADSLNFMCNVLQQRKDWLALYGIDYYVFFPPLKHTIYEEKLPSRIKKTQGPSKMDLLLKAIEKNTDVRVIDLRQVLLDAKKIEEKPLYYYVDSHWNLLGAHYAYLEIMQAINKNHPLVGEPIPQEAYHWFEMSSTNGDLASVLSLNNYLLRSEIVPDPAEGYCADSVASIEYSTYESVHDVQTREVRGEDREMLKLVMNRDSYSNFLIPYFSEHFERSVYLWTPVFNAEIVKQEMPDLFITEMLERFMSDLMLGNPPIVEHELDSARAVDLLLETQAEIVSTER